jgi:hypothetical protein
VLGDAAVGRLEDLEQMGERGDAPRVEIAGARTNVQAASSKRPIRVPARETGAIPAEG